MGAWIRAARPLALANIALPLLLGAAFGARITGRFDGPAWGAALVFGVLDQLFIVFANDYADADADASNTTFNLFSGGSRMIPDGRLSRAAVGRAAVVAAVGLLLWCLLLSAVWQRWLLLPCWAAAILLLWAYSFAPLRLSYRGHGEGLQAVGLGVVLPVVGFHLQVGGWRLPSLQQLAVPVLLGFAGNILTSLPDYPSDRANEKRTWPVRTSQRSGRLAFVIIVAIATLGVPQMISPTLDGVAAVQGGSGLLLLASLLWVRSGDADNRTQCRRFVIAGGAAVTWLLAGTSAVLLLD